MEAELATTPDEQEISSGEAIEPLVSLAAALMDTDRLRIAAALVSGPANRMQLAEQTGLSHKDLLRQLGLLQHFGLVRLEEPAPARPDHYSRYELNSEALRTARAAMGKYLGRKPRPTEGRALTLETFMPGGKLTSFPRKQEQLTVVLDEVAGKFEAQRQYAEREVNEVLGEINEDFCTLRRLLVDHGYMSRSQGIYTRNV